MFIKKLRNLLKKKELSPYHKDHPNNKRKRGVSVKSKPNDDDVHDFNHNPVHKSAIRKQSLSLIN